MSQKERIIDQAMQMFVTQGIKAVRMDDIAQQLSVSKRTLYELFGDKEELLFQALLHHFELRDKYHTELTANADNVLHAMFMVLNDVMDNSEQTCRMVMNLQKFHPAVYDRLTLDGKEKHRQSMRQCLEQGIQDGLFLDYMNLDLTVSVLYYTASALFTIRGGVDIPDKMTENEAYIQILTCFFRGISTTKGIQLIDSYIAEHQLLKEKTIKVY